MIRISTRVLYGVRAIIYLGLNKDKWPIPLSDIAEYQNIPLRYIEQIFIKFKKANIVKSIRGVKGGYILRDGFEEMTLLEIVEAADNKIIPVWCLNPMSKRKCPIVEDCMMVEIWKGLGDEIKDYLSKIKLKDILVKAEQTNFLELFQKMGKRIKLQ